MSRMKEHGQQVTDQAIADLIATLSAIADIADRAKIDATPSAFLCFRGDVGKALTSVPTLQGLVASLADQADRLADLKPFWPYPEI